MTSARVEMSAQWLRIAVSTLLFIAAADFGFLFYSSGSLTPVWPAAAVALATALLYGPATLAGIALYIAYDYLSAGPIHAERLVGMLVEPLSMVLTASLARWVVQRRGIDLSLRSLRATVELTVLALGVASLNALLVSIGYCVGVGTRACTNAGFGGHWLQAMTGDLFGLWICLPALLTWCRALDPTLRASAAGQDWGVGLPDAHQRGFILVAAGFGLLAWWMTRVLPVPVHVVGFFSLPLLVWAAISFRPLFVRTAVLVIGLATVSLQLTAKAPTLGDPATQLASIFLFILSLSLLTQLVAVAIERQRELAADLADSAARARTELLLAAAPDAVVNIDRKARITYWNPAAERLFGLLRHQALGRDVRTLLSPEGVRLAEDAGFADFFRSGDASRLGHMLEVDAIHADGRTIPVEIALAGYRDGEDWQATAFVRDLSLKRAQAAAIAEVEVRIRDLTDRLPLAVFQVIREPGRLRCTFASSHWRVFGIEPEALMADTAAAIALIHDADRERVEAGMLTAIHSDRFWSDEFRLKTATGTATRWVSAQATPTRSIGGEAIWNGFWQDVTDRHQAQEDLMQARDLAQDSRRRLMDLSDALPLTIFQMRQEADGTRWYPFAGAQVRQMLGVEHRILIADPAARWRNVVEPDQQRCRALVEEAVRQHTGTCFDHVVEVDGARRIIHTETVCSPADHGAWVWNGYWADVTETRQQEDALRLAKEAAEAATRAKSMFLANMSHEIRTPMNAIIGLAYLALQTPLDAKQRDYVEKVHQAGVSLLGIINDILDFSKIEAGKLDIEQIEFDLDDLLAQVAAVTRARAAEKGLDYVFEVPMDLPERWQGDPLRLSQVLINLLNNAIKFTESGHVRLWVRALESDPSRLCIEVEDTGIGMDATQTARLFTPFSQADGSTTRRFGGTGLGLSICKRLVDMMGGELRVSSAPGVGSRFTCVLPLRRVGNDLPKPPMRKWVASVVATPVVRDALLRALEGCGVTIGEAEDADLMFLQSAFWQSESSGGSALRVVLLSHESEAERFAEASATLVAPVSRRALRTLLVQSSPWQKGAPVLPAQPPVSDQVFPGQRVLLVEDNEINRQIARELMTGMGLVVEEAVDGLAALACLNAHTPDHFSACLMDLQMPNLDGHETTRRIRQDARFQHLPIIAMTAHAMVEERERCLREGMQDHLSKPVDPKLLQACLARWLGVAERESRPQASTQPTLVIAGIDTVAGLAACGGKQALYQRLLQQFPTRFRTAATRVRQALHDDLRTAAREAHTLRGVAANLGMTGVTAAAADLEAALQDGAATNDATLVPMLDVLDAQLGAVCHAIESVLPPQDVPALADRLAALLAAQDAEAADFAARHAETLQTWLGPSFATVLRTAQHYDFDAASALLAALCARARKSVEPRPAAIR